MLAQVDTDTDALYQQTLGNKGSEYEATEAQARVFEAAEWQGTPGELVRVWAEIKGWSDQQAAEDILRGANRWRATQVSIRAARLRAKETLRTASDSAGIDSAYATWLQFLAHIPSELS